jgi:hypothetical protein
MCNTSQPIRKFLALAFIVMIIALVSQSVFAGNGGKPPEPVIPTPWHGGETTGDTLLQHRYPTLRNRF